MKRILISLLLFFFLISLSCTRDKNALGYKNNNFLNGEWKLEKTNQIDGDWIYTISKYIYKFDGENFERSFYFEGHDINNPSDKETYSEIIKGTYSIISENLFDLVITYFERNDTKHENINLNLKIIYNKIDDDHIEFSTEDIGEATTELTQISGESGTLINSAFHYYITVSDSEYLHFKYLFTNNLLLKSKTMTASMNLPNEWAHVDSLKIDIIDSKSFYIWWDETTQNKSYMMYIFYNDKLYLGKNYEKFYRVK
ncbi:hypothetical protein Calab_0828 [Caldithrix abyssi DSM 13497]|uniref:Lipocalin-like domain-containing protein n=1 Tax=Caldithrix abyssi DSM 13497 TaxID=880073 RepID=H1XU23_CALAY|nr:hypothetical protein [Caldithrix abyssi]APF16885.1 hypothetical protein Cabys_134 [Caldithrix abyssi DSM 13497]EHO40466.1 hypothetical protein Calab_0828 [Caldithrix abyssi DSM 13497]